MRDTQLATDKSRGQDGFLKTPLKLIGAKTGHAKVSGRSLIYEMIDYSRPLYVEPFLGSGAVLVGKQPHSKEIVGDIQPYTINFFNTLQQSPELLWEYLEGMIHYVQTGMDRNSPDYKYFHYLRDNMVQPVGVQGATWFYLITKLCTNGIFRVNSRGKCNSSWCKQYNGRGYLTREWFWKVQNRIRMVEFRCEAYTDLLDNTPEEAMVVLDPPYMDVFTSYDRRKFTNSDHVELADILKSANYKWLLTINDVPKVRELYKGYNMREVELNYSCSQTASGRGKHKELFITNYDWK